MIAPIHHDYCIIGILQHDGQEEDKNLGRPIAPVCLAALEAQNFTFLRNMLNKGEKTGTSHASSQKEWARVTTSHLFTWFIHFIIARGNVTIDHIDILLIGHTKLRHRPQDISELAMSVTKNHNPTSQITLSYALLKCHSVIPFKTGKRKKYLQNLWAKPAGPFSISEKNERD